MPRKVKDLIGTDQIPLESITLVIHIEAKFDIDKFDNGSDVDESIESALQALQSLGSASITKREIYGKPKLPTGRKE